MFSSTANNYSAWQEWTVPHDRTNIRYDCYTPPNFAVNHRSVNEEVFGLTEESDNSRFNLEPQPSLVEPVDPLLITPVPILYEHHLPVPAECWFWLSRFLPRFPLEESSVPTITPASRIYEHHLPTSFNYSSPSLLSRFPLNESTYPTITPAPRIYEHHYYHHYSNPSFMFPRNLEGFIYSSIPAPAPSIYQYHLPDPEQPSFDDSNFNSAPQSFLESSIDSYTPSYDYPRINSASHQFLEESPEPLDLSPASSIRQPSVVDVVDLISDDDDDDDEVKEEIIVID